MGAPSRRMQTRLTSIKVVSAGAKEHAPNSYGRLMRAPNRWQRISSHPDWPKEVAADLLLSRLAQTPRSGHAQDSPAPVLYLTLNQVPPTAKRARAKWNTWFRLPPRGLMHGVGSTWSGRKTRAKSDIWFRLPPRGLMHGVGSTWSGRKARAKWSAWFRLPPRGQSMVTAQHDQVERHVRSRTSGFAYPPADRAWCRLNMVRSKGTCEVGHLVSPTPPRTEHGAGSTWSGRKALLVA